MRSLRKKGGESNKMSNNDGWTRVSGRSDETWDKNKDKEVSGVLIEIRSNIGPNGSKMYSLQKPDGKVISVWGSSMLDNRMASIPLGNEVRIVYLGKEMNPKTHRSYHNFDIMTRKPTVSAAPATETPAKKEEVTKSAPEAEQDVNPDDIPF